MQALEAAGCLHVHSPINTHPSNLKKKKRKTENRLHSGGAFLNERGTAWIAQENTRPFQPSPIYCDTVIAGAGKGAAY